MKHLEEQTGIISKEEFREMMRTNNADKFFEKRNVCGYDIVPKEEYYLEGCSLLQIFSLYSEDDTRCVSIDVFANLNEDTGHFEPEVYFERLHLVDKELDEWDWDKGDRCNRGIDYNRDDWWEQLEDYMRELLKGEE